MNNPPDELGHQKVLFALGLIVFAVMAGLGWNKLQYGFNFIDEGMYMADGWRLAAGDRLFPDSPTNVTTMYSVFNAGIFSLVPDIILLGFRKLQYVLALASVILFGLAVYRWSREYWYAPYIASIFAFTGLDTLGMSANMSYYTYPHMFLTLHVATLLFGLKSADGAGRTLLLLLAGVFLWAVGFSLLPLSLGIVSPFLTWILLRRADAASVKFSGKDVLLVTVPPVILWFGVLAAYNVDFIVAMSDSHRYVIEGNSTGIGVNTLALQYLAVAAVFVTLIIAGAGQKSISRPLIAAALFAVMFFILETNFFGLIALFWRGWFAAQMWFCALLIVSLVAFFAALSTRKVQGRLTEDRLYLLTVIFVPSALFAVLFGNYSGMGILSTSYISIPAALGIATLFVGWLKYAGARVTTQAAFVVTMFLPFYYNLAWADWKFTYFDVPPSKMTHTISKGFGAGIKTNVVFHSIAEWMEKKAAQYSDPTDFAIVLDETSMGYMLIKRRPALNHSYTGWGGSPALRRDAVAIMIREQRVPRIAFRFVRAPMFFPLSLKAGTFTIAGRRNFGADDPVSNYIQANMVLTDKIQIQDEVLVELFVRPAADGTVSPVS